MERNAKIAKKKLDSIAKRIGDKEFTVIKFFNLMNKEFKSLKVKFLYERIAEHKWALDLNIHPFVASGFYNRYFREGVEDHRYEVIVYVHKSQPTLKISESFFKEIFLVMVHEFRHGYQHRRRNYKNRRSPDTTFKFYHKEFQNHVRYLSDYDEIDAYAMETAIARDENYFTFKTYGKLKDHSFSSWKRFMKKVYLFSHK